MTLIGSPVEIPLAYGNRITGAIDDFAKEQGLEAISWYHDEPIWFVKRRQEQLVTRVQVAAFRGLEGTQVATVIRLIPDAYIVDGTSIRAHIDPEQISGFIATVPLDGRAPSEIEADLRSYLAKTWAEEVSHAWFASR